MMDFICNPTRPKWQFYLMTYTLVILIGVTIGALGGVLTKLITG